MMRSPTKHNAGRRYLRPLLNLLLLLLVFLGAKAWLERGMIAGEVPELHGLMLDGSVVSLEDYRGAPVLLHFWATWCGICRMEQGGIESVSRHWPVLTVATQSGDARELQAYMDERALRHAVMVDETGALAARFGVGAVPASFVIDASGRVRYRHRGYATAWGLRLRLWAASLD